MDIELEYVDFLCKEIVSNSKELLGLRIHSFIYKNKVLVIDFTDGYLRFAIDIKECTRKKEYYNLELVYRNKETQSLFIKKQCKERIEEVSKANLKIELENYFSYIVSMYNSLYLYDVSVIIPVYNREDYITRCVESLNRQNISFNKFEVIFVDDFSIDESIRYIERTISSNINYRIIKRNSNSGGASIPRNDGMTIAQGKYLFFVDSDDCIFDYTLKDSLNYIAKNNTDILYLKMTSSDKSRSVPSRTYQQGNIAKAEYVSNHLCRTLNPIKFYRSALIKTNNIFFPNYRTNEDRIFSLEAISKANTISILGDKPYYDTFNHESGQLTRKFGLKIEQHIEVCLIFIVKIINSGLENKNKNRLFNNMLSVIADILISYSKKSNYQTILPYFVLLKKTFDASDLIYNADLAYPEHRMFLNKFDSFDFYNAWKLYN